MNGYTADQIEYMNAAGQANPAINRILTLIELGISSAEIACSLKLSRKTVKQNIKWLSDFGFSVNIDDLI